MFLFFTLSDDQKPKFQGDINKDFLEYTRTLAVLADALRQQALNDCGDQKDRVAYQKSTEYRELKQFSEACDQLPRRGHWKMKGPDGRREIEKPKQWIPGPADNFCGKSGRACHENFWPYIKSMGVSLKTQNMVEAELDKFAGSKDLITKMRQGV